MPAAGVMRSPLDPQMPAPGLAGSLTRDFLGQSFVVQAAAADSSASLVAEREFARAVVPRSRWRLPAVVAAVLGLAALVALAL
jgi:hypothetical protein